MALDTYLSIKNLSFGYGSRRILENVSMDFGRGKVVAIMGGSGMGKTTLLKLIGGLLTPDAGEIRVGGEKLDPSDRKGLYRLRRRMGMLFNSERSSPIFPSTTTLPFRSASRRISTKKPCGILFS